MGKREGRKETRKDKQARALREGHKCKVRGEKITLDLCLVEQTRHPGDCRGCWNLRG